MSARKAMRLDSPCFFLVLAAAIILACGSPHNVQSISVVPATADAKNYRSGQVQFAAVGRYSSSS
jgi:hypothetical protein